MEKDEGEEEGDEEEVEGNEEKVEEEKWNSRRRMEMRRKRKAGGV